VSVRLSPQRMCCPLRFIRNVNAMNADTELTGGSPPKVQCTVCGSEKL